MNNHQSIRSRFQTPVTMLAAGAGLALFCLGCASANIDSLTRTKATVVEPDFLLVRDLTVKANEVKLDSGLLSQISRDNSKPQTAQELELGKAAATAFTDELVECLRKAGIRAAKVSDKATVTDRTVIISGQFVRIDQGNRTMRVLVGFGMGSGDLSAMLECHQGGKLLASATISTSGGLKPGILVPVAGGAAAGTVVVSSAVAGTATAASETFSATVKADAQRAAKNVAERLVKAYINHGWAKPDALDRMHSIF